MGPADNSASKYCIVGAGSSGLAAAKNLLAAGLPFDCLEREDDVGGNWYYGKPHSSVYRSTHLISSKPLTEYTDYPMPAEYPDYPSHQQVWDYLRSYARHFNLYSHIQFHATIDRIEPAGDLWRVMLAGGDERLYRGVIIANGHNWDPKRPAYPGHFRGLTLHSAEYKTPEVLADRRVLVVGAGNSGCDIAVESAQNAAATFHSTRRGYHYIPKYFRGAPADQWGEFMHRWRLPLWLRRFLAFQMIHVAFGDPTRFGLPKPDHRLLESHPIINSQLIYYVGHGRIKMKPDVAELCGDLVRFTDGSQEPIDVIIYATGFNITFPFIDRKYLNYVGERPELYLNIFHPQYDNLCVCGLIQPDSGQFGLVDYQAQLIARFLAALDRNPSLAARFRRQKMNTDLDLGCGIHYVNSSRHLLEVEHFSYRERLKQQIAQFA